MQDRYVGDIGDFAKYALLRALAPQHALRLGIVWCMFADEGHNADGRHVGYLRRQDLRNLDPILHDRLLRIVTSGNRSVRQVIKAGLFSSNTVSFSSPTSPLSSIRTGRAFREKSRTRWISKALNVTDSCELVFFDPDNGLETPSVPRHSPKAGKYMFLDELGMFWRRGQSLILYHHLNRTASVEQQTAALRKRLTADFPNVALLTSLLFRRGSCRHFWILGQQAHRAELEVRIEAMLNLGWRAHFEIG